MVEEDEAKLKQSYLIALAAWQKKYDAWIKESAAYVKRHPMPSPSEAMILWNKEMDELRKGKPPRTEAEKAWDKEYRAFGSRHPFPRKPTPEYEKSTALVPVSDHYGQAGRDLGFVLPTEINALTQGDETGKHEYICGKASEVLLLGDSTTFYEGNSNQIVVVDEASPTGSTKRSHKEISSSWNGKLLCLPSNATYASDVTVNTKSDLEDALQWKIAKTDTSKEYDTHTAHTSNNFDDDVYEISPPLAKKHNKSRKSKGKGY